MKIITANITEQNLIITPSVISVAESVGLYALKISYDEEWDEVDTKIVTFTAPTGISIATQDLGAEEGVVIPWEVLQSPGKVSVGVVGYVGTAVKVTTTGLYKRNTFVVQPEAFGLQDAMTPTPDVYQTLIQTINEINDSITNLQNNIDVVADDVAETVDNIGDLEALETTNKDNLVDAINEVLSGAGGGAVSSVNGKTGVVVLNTSDLENTSGYQTSNDVAEAILIETTARELADSGLQGQIDALAASSDVTDIVGTYADLQAYDTQHLKDNDIIKVLQDESQNGETTYYRWSTTTQTFTLIGEEGPYYTKSAADIKFQDKLTPGANVSIDANNKISATDTTYSDFTGTDGQTAGAAGLVPAPAIADFGKFLKADGTWDIAGGAGIETLDAADWTNDDIQIDNLNPGIYKVTYTGAGAYGRILNGNKPLQSYVTKNMTSVLMVSEDRYNSPHKIGLIFSDENDSSNPKTWLWVNGYNQQRTSVLYNDQSGEVHLGQNATTGYSGQVAIGKNAQAIGVGSSITVVGEYAQSNQSRGTALGGYANANSRGGVALGAYSTSSTQGEVNIGSSVTSWGYNNTNFRVIRGLHDGEQDNDATNLKQLNARIVGSGTATPTTATVGSVGSLYAYVESGTGHLAICTDDTGGTYTWQTLI